VKYSNVVFDVNVLVNYILKRGEFQNIEKIVEQVIENKVKGWIAAQSLPVIEYIIRRTLKTEGVSSEESKRIAQEVNHWIVKYFNILSLPGEEVKKIINQTKDLEDTEIAIAASSLGADACIVTEDRDFDALGKIALMTPAELLASQKENSQTPIPVLDLAAQQRTILPELEASIRQVLLDGQYIMGRELKLFEQEVASYLGVKHAIGVNSGTDALVIGLKAMGIGEGDEVITTPFSFFATAESISNVGAQPIFVDIDSKNFNIDPQKIKAKITAKTKAIMPVHLYGNPALMGQILEIAAEYGLKVIEDCAQSFGARYYGTCSTCNGACLETTKGAIAGKQTGTIGNVGAFSFFPSKNLGAYGDGGLIATDDDQIAEVARMLRVHGAKKKYHNEILGYNSRLDTLQSAILRVKLPHIDEWNEGRRKVAKTYQELLANVEEIITPEIADGHVFHQYTIRILNGKRDSLKNYLNEQGIGSMIYYPIPQDKLPIYQGQYEENPVSDLLATEVLSLPIWSELETSVIEIIVAAIKQGLAIRE
jgi:dTDP-4-amino-4,6-dideoxygalactose transaminase/predicted nucleic acid-binding protein